MPAMTAGLAMLPALMKGGVGGVQLIGGLAGMLGARRPKYPIPAAATQALGVAQQQAMRQEMPGESIMRAQVGQQGANALGAAREYGMAGLASLPAIQAMMQSGNLQIGAQSAQWRDQQLAQYMAALNQYAQFQDQEWQMNKFAPFMDRLQRSQNAIGAGVKNLAGGADSALMTMLGMPDLFGRKSAGTGQNMFIRGMSGPFGQSMMQKGSPWAKMIGLE